MSARVEGRHQNMLRILLVVAAVSATASAGAASDKIVAVSSRGQMVRALLVTADNPMGSVILLAGGHGNLDLGTDGKIGWGADNELVRTRAAYAAAGFD